MGNIIKTAQVSYMLC